MRKILFLYSVLLLVMVSCVQSPGGDQSHIYIISTNDMHANIEAMPRLATLVKEFEAKGVTIVVDSGDRVTGNAYVDDDAQPGIPMIELMNAVGYDVVTLGNHEFDKGREVLYSMVAASDFEWVCSNIKDAEEEGFSPYAMVDIDGVNIGFVGAVATDFNGRPIGSDAAFKGFSFSDDRTTSYEVCQSVASKSDFVVLLSHMGYDIDCRFANMTPACDWVAGGHSHDTVNTSINGVHISQNRKDMRYVTVADIVVCTGDIMCVEYTQVAIADYAEDESVRVLVEDVKSRDLELNTVVAHANTDAIKSGIANFTCDALKNYVYEEGFEPEVVFYHYGGIRLSEIKEGDVKRVDILNNDPFISTIYIGDMNVEEMCDFILAKYNSGTAEKPDKESHYVYFYSNVPYEIVLGAECDNQIDAVDVRFDLEPRRYRVAMCNYIAENYLDKEVLARSLRPSGVTVREAMLREMNSYGKAGFTPDNNVYQVEIKE